MYREPAERLPMDISSYIREAGHCLQERRFLASIAMASTAVEIILNRDRRLKVLPNYKASDGWAYLNNRTLRTARENGLPTDKLLSPGDDLNERSPLLGWSKVHRADRISTVARFLEVTSGALLYDTFDLT
jgi:hypothetical protein